MANVLIFNTVISLQKKAFVSLKLLESSYMIVHEWLIALVFERSLGVD